MLQTNNTQFVILGNDNFHFPHGLYILGGIAYSVNGLGIFKTTQFRTITLFSADKSVKLSENDRIVYEIELRGLYREIIK